MATEDGRLQVRSLIFPAAAGYVAAGLLSISASPAWLSPGGVHDPSSSTAAPVFRAMRGSHEPGSNNGWASPAVLMAVSALGARPLHAALIGRQRRGRCDASAVRTMTLEREVAAQSSSSPGAGINPATCWPAGRESAYTTEYSEVYDLKDPKGSFEKIGRRLLDEMTGELGPLYELPKKEVDWVAASLDYNSQGGKMNRGLIAVETGVAMMRHQGREPSNADLNRFAVLGWAVELLQACMLMADDLMDGSITRRGASCWYRLPHVGLLATNDFLMVEMFVYKVMKRHFGKDPVFPWLVDLMLETTFQTECGQLLDSICANCTLEELTTDRWTLIVKYKTAFYSFYLPVALALLATGVRDRAAFDVAREVLLTMGIYFQAQDDYLDAFACPEVLGKVGTDIADKKCSWLFAHAYHEHGTPEAKALLDEHYGKCKVGSPEEQKIKDLYIKLGLQELFLKYESETQEKLKTYEAKVREVGLPWSVFESFWALIFKRQK